MRISRNPFKLRASEQIVPDETFLQLFDARVLDLISENSWDKVRIFQSAPGGGKTSLFRVFTPASLVTLHRLRTHDDYKELHQRLEALGVTSASGPNSLGVMLSCAQGYAMLEDLDLDSAQKERLLYSLLNIRTILAALRGICVLRNLDYSKDLERLQIGRPNSSQFPEWFSVLLPCSGKELAEWATKIEENICEAIDSFDPLPRTTLKGHDTLFSLQLLRPETITLEGSPIADRVIVMFDDVHKLTTIQRRKLLDTLLSSRWPVSVWIAERLEALTADELLSSGATSGRDYEIISLEEYWGGKANRFEDVITSIADKRVRFASDAEIGSFAGCLQNTFAETELQDRYENACNVISDRLFKRFGADERYKEWLAAEARVSGTPHDRAVEWRILEILIERNIAEMQMSLPLPLSPEEIEKKAPPVKSTAEFLVTQEFDIPYYFGLSKLAILSSSNIDQFLDFAGELFEQIISATLLRQQVILSPHTQQDILKKVLNRRWDEIPRRVPNGREVQKLLTAIKEYARWETNRPTAPYGPGVTGIGLSMGDREKLTKSDIHRIQPQYERVATLLSSCISNNLLEPRFVTQGQKGQQWLVLYLNRWLCLEAGLPLHYGGWRHIRPNTFHDWLERGFHPPRSGDLV
jgi:hypothetical protein